MTRALGVLLALLFVTFSVALHAQERTRDTWRQPLRRVITGRAR